ncbi:MAG: Gfo/Idh/MocA family oxidoreductase [Chloroflexi bacterium]|nr:Gfo/Idh/MocA family oxidoreductase [Chloroflexota bacterium]
MRFLIAGLGSIGRRHLRNLIALGEHDIVLYRTHRSTLPDDELAAFPTETDLQRALTHYRPDAVIVANPTAHHLDVAIPAAQAGCHLLIEKPIAHDLRGVDALQRAVEANHVRVLVGFQFRFHPTLNAVRGWLAEARIGKPLFARAHWGEYLPDWHPWEDYRQSYAARADLGGGVVRTLCHPLDYLRYLLGEAEVVWAHTGNLSPLELQGVEDFAEIGLWFASGAEASVHLDYFQRPPQHWLEIEGTQGTIRWEYASGEALALAADKTVLASASLPPSWERNTMFLDEMRHFLAVVRGEAFPRCTLEDGVRALALALDALATT